tara:strand:- start:307 stop:963 length:657 start_codon:yes stop_codon:yes gene_type:complete
MKNELNLADLKIYSFTLDFGLDFVHEKKDKKMDTNTKTYIADGNGVTTSQFVAIEKPSRRKFKKFNEAFLNELNREELFIGSLGLRMLEETDEASNLDYVQEEVKNIYGRTIRKIRTYSDGSVQIFQCVAKKSNRHFYNGAIYTYITRKFTTGSNEPVVDGEPVKTKQKSFYGNQLANLKTVHQLSRFGLARRLQLAKQSSELAIKENQLQARKYGSL